MNTARWEQVKSVLGDALERADAVERASFLAQACAGDTSLRREVESLLQHSSDRLDVCAEELSVSGHEAATSTAGRRVGAYEIVRELGRGGMGAVYLATRADREFQKEVAIKILKRGTDTDEVLSRFRAEREILARLEHPNIARLLDGGTTDDGLPYFVMEYVAGARITDYCFANSLSVPDRLKLFLKVCGAVQFAHQNLIVHRDLKPANILITAEGEPKLLDFGIAKLLDPAGATIEVTAVERQRLTPAYASPEQVRGEPITTVSDVYAMGALLYELLAGAPPHRFATANPSPTELLRVIGDVSPTRPSAIAASVPNRPRVSSDLDRIVLKALRKERAARYPGVGSFADDINRFLKGQPVRARRATFGYRARKFVIRNKAWVGAATVAFAIFLGGVGMIVSNARRAESEARRAQRHFEDVRQLAGSFVFEFDDAIAGLPGATAARQLVVNRALEYLDKLAREAFGDRTLQLELAEAYLKVGDVQGRPYTANLGDSAGALRSYAKAGEIAGMWMPSEKNSPRHEARSIVSRAYVDLAAVQARAGDLAEATASNSRALAILNELLADAPEQAPQWHQLIASCHLGLGDAIQAGNHQRGDLEAYRAALRHYRDALPGSEQLVAAHPESVEDLRRLGKVCSRIAGILAELGSRTADDAVLDESLHFHARRLELDEKAARLDPNNWRLQRNIADGLIAMSYARVLAMRDLPLALQDCARALGIEEPLAAADRQNREAQQDLSYAQYVTGRVYQAQGDRAAAAAHYRRSIRILEPLVAANPNNVETAFDLDRARRGLAETQP